jgi:recombinational DNA repair ATPase RecF
MKIKKKNLKKPNHEKNWLKFWKNQLVRFGFDFISLKPNRTEPKPKKTEKKLSQNQAKPKNRVKPVFILKNRTEPKQVDLNQFLFGFGFIL